MVTNYVLLLTIIACVNCDLLKQVVILSRHNIRTPLGTTLSSYTQKVWPKWIGEPGWLTTKGGLLEENLGEFFKEWLVEEKLLTEECPDENTVYVYANNYERTRQTAEYFSKSAFKQCNVTIHYRSDVIADPVFSQVLLNTSEEFLTIARNEMKENLNRENLTNCYEKLNDILDIKNSQVCNNSNICDLTKAPVDFVLEYDEQPQTNTNGALRISNSVVDAFLMAYYDGNDLENIAWGEMTIDDLKMLHKITRTDVAVRFNGTIIAKHEAKHLVNYIENEFANATRKLTLLVAHDSNMNSLSTALGFNWYELEGQYENTPIGGKIVFEKWYDEILKRDFVKLRLVYMTTEQIRKGVRIDKNNPPRSLNLRLREIREDEEKKGFYRFEDFMQFLAEFR